MSTESLQKTHKDLNKLATTNVFNLGLSMCFLFLSFNTTQNFETTINGDLGFKGLAMIYIFFSAFNLVAPSVVMKLGDKISIILGAIAYLCFLASNIYVIEWVFLCVSALTGIGAAILWCAQGSILARCSNINNFGRHSGIFFFLFQCNQILGNILIFFLIKFGVALFTIFIVFTIVGVIATLSFSGLRLTPLPKQGSKIPLPLKRRLLVVLELIFDRNMRLLWLPMIFSGLSQSYFYGLFPKICGIDNIGAIMCCFGIFDASTSLLFGRLSDKIGRLPLLYISSFCMMIGISVTQWAVTVDSDPIPGYFLPLLFLSAILFGITDGGYNTLLFATLGTYFPSNSEAAYSTFKFFQSVFTSLAFFIAPNIPFFYMGITSTVFLISGFLSYTFLIVKRKPPPCGDLDNDDQCSILNNSISKEDSPLSKEDSPFLVDRKDTS